MQQRNENKRFRQATKNFKRSQQSERMNMASSMTQDDYDELEDEREQLEYILEFGGYDPDSDDESDDYRCFF
tara:strand:+ start:2890 stop:3105 length:216 start_codon:yes stop_codon:yes gene_type:complete